MLTCTLSMILKVVIITAFILYIGTLKDKK